MDVNEILNGLGGGDNCCRPINNCDPVRPGFGGCGFGGNWIWLVLLFWLCGGCGCGSGFGGFGGYNNNCCCSRRRNCCDNNCCNSGCSCIIYLIIIAVLCGGFGSGRGCGGGCSPVAGSVCN